MSKKNGKKSSGKDFQKELKDAAQSVWLAGLGALSAAEQEGSKLFKKLVARGQQFEQENRPWVAEAAQRARVRFEEGAEAAKSKLGTVVEDASKAVDDQVTSTLERLGVPSKDEIHRLAKRVEELTARLEALSAEAAQKSPAKAAKKEPAAKQAAAPKVASAAVPGKPAARKPAVKKSPDA